MMADLVDFVAFLPNLAGPDGILILLILLILFLSVVFPIWMIVDCVKHESRAGNGLLIWILVIFFLAPLGAIIYFFARKLLRTPQLPPGAESSVSSRRVIAVVGVIAAVVLSLGGAIFLFRDPSPEITTRERIIDSDKIESPDPTPTRPVDVNTATANELDAIPYVSRTLAEAIIAHRPYSSHEDLLAVPGIKKRMLERIRPYTTVEPPP